MARQSAQVANELSIEKKLNEPITLNIKEMALGDAIAFIQNYTGLNVMLDPQGAQRRRAEPATQKVSLQANSIKLKSALKFMLRPLNLTYKAEDDVLLITSPQAYRDKTVMWHYPVADLVVSPDKAQPRSTARAADHPDRGRRTRRDGHQQRWPGRQGQSASRHRDGHDAADQPDHQHDRPGHVAGDRLDRQGRERLRDGRCLRWWRRRRRPAQPGSITPFMLSISLIIRHTAEVHEEVAELLKQLRRLQDLQVSIEVRFITVSDDFFEQIGVDFDFNIQSDAVGKKTTFAAPNPAAALFPFNRTSTAGPHRRQRHHRRPQRHDHRRRAAGGTTRAEPPAARPPAAGDLGRRRRRDLGPAASPAAAFAGGGGGIGGAGIGGGTAGNTGGGTTGGGGGRHGGHHGWASPELPGQPVPRPLARSTDPDRGRHRGWWSAELHQQPRHPLDPGVCLADRAVQRDPDRGATFGISFLSDLEMYLFLTAAQGDARNNIVQAPKVTTFNGAQASIINQQQQNYIQSLTPVVGAGAVAFTPQVGTLPDGVQLNVTPVVSADRRYVRLSLAPQFNTVDALTTLTFPAAAVGGGGLGGQATALNTDHPAPADHLHHDQHHRHRPRRRHGAPRWCQAAPRATPRVRRPGPGQDPARQPPVPQHRDRSPDR